MSKIKKTALLQTQNVMQLVRHMVLVSFLSKRRIAYSFNIKEARRMYATWMSNNYIDRNEVDTSVVEDSVDASDTSNE